MSISDIQENWKYFQENALDKMQVQCYINMKQNFMKQYLSLSPNLKKDRKAQISCKAHDFTILYELETNPTL